MANLKEEGEALVYSGLEGVCDSLCTRWHPRLLSSKKKQSHQQVASVAVKEKRIFCPQKLVVVIAFCWNDQPNPSTRQEVKMPILASEETLVLLLFHFSLGRE